MSDLEDSFVAVCKGKEGQEQSSGEEISRQRLLEGEATPLQKA